MKGSTVRLVAVVIGLGAIAGLAIWRFWPGPAEDANGDQRPGPSASRPSKKAAADLAAARKAQEDGLALYNAGEMIEARRKLSEAFFSGHLTHEQENKIIPVMTELADKTLLSGNFYSGDPYVFRQMIERGDTLSSLAKKWELRVPWRFLAKINNLDSTAVIREGASITMVQGPFHAIVRKSRFLMDVYLHREKMPKIFIKRFGVGIGNETSPTPNGLWEVTPGGKQEKTPWYPPGSGLIRRTKIQWGEPGYPLGKKGYWIPLTGRDPENRNIPGIGMHGTNDPTSVGKAVSLGCLRLLDEDMEWAFAMLYDKWSTVLVLP